MKNMKKILFACLGFLATILMSFLLHFSVNFLPSAILYPWNGILVLLVLSIGICLNLFAEKTCLVRFFLNKNFLTISCLYYLGSILLLLFVPQQISCGDIVSIKQWNAYWGTCLFSIFFMIGLSIRCIDSFRLRIKTWVQHIFLYIGLICIVFHVQWGCNDIVQKELIVGKQATAFLQGGDEISLQNIDFHKNNPIVCLHITANGNDTTYVQLKANYPFHYKGWDILLMSCDKSEMKSWVKLCFVYDIWKQTFKIGVCFVFLHVIINLLIIPIFVDRNVLSKPL